MATTPFAYEIPGYMQPRPRAVNPAMFAPAPYAPGSAAQQAAQPTQAATTGEAAGQAMLGAAGQAMLGAAGPMAVLNPVVGGALAVGGTLAGVAGSMANNEVQRRNRAQLERLQRLEASGDLGLTPLQRRQMQQALESPVQRAAAEGRLAAERQVAAVGAGGASAGDLQRLQQQQTAMSAAGRQQAAQTVTAADAQRAAEQRAEIDQRLAAKAQMRADDMASIFGSLAKSAAAGGAIAGAPPGTMPNTLLGAAGLPVSGAGVAGTGLSQDELNELALLSPPERARILQQFKAARALKAGG